MRPWLALLLFAALALASVRAEAQSDARAASDVVATDEATAESGTAVETEAAAESGRTSETETAAETGATETAAATGTGGRSAGREAGEDVVSALETAVVEGGGPALPATTLRIEWRESWPRYSFDELVLTAGLGLLLVAALALPTAAFEPNWRGGILFDDPVREGLRLRSFAQRNSSAIASEVMQFVLIGFPFVVDALATAGIGEGSWDLALQMGLISVEAYVISLVFWRVTSLLARRERPLTALCEAGDTSAHCEDPNLRATESFFSNQATNAFTGAGLTCLHHTAMPLWNDEAADATACVSALTIAAMVGLLRVMSDFEYLTDVLAGAVVGLASGWLLPYLLHYQGGARPELRPPVSFIPAPLIGPNDTYGLQVIGIF